MKSNYLIAKFWSRIGAFLIDMVLLGLLGLILGLTFKTYFISIGKNGVFFGFVISLAYFAIFNSKWLGGQTLGKRLTNIKVVDQDDQFLSLKFY